MIPSPAADRTLALIDELGGELQIEMFPGLHSAIRELLMVLVGADLCELGNINVRNSMVLDEHRVADGPDELPAAAAIVLAALPIDFVGSSGEAVQVQVPQRILVHFHLVDMVGGFAQLCEMTLNRFLEFAEFHNFFSFQKYKTKAPQSRETLVSFSLIVGHFKLDHDIA